MPTVNARMQRRACVVGACGIAALAVAPAAQAQTADVRPGKNVAVFANVGFVAATGYVIDSTMRVEVVRDGHTIASASGSALSTAEGIGLEVNHGPLGAPLPGDCWTNFTPNIRGGDTVRITGDGGTDTIGIDDIRITVAPYLNDAGDVIFEGVARYFDGTPIPVAALDSGEARFVDAPRLRATPTTVERIDGTVDGWRATYERAQGYGVFRDDGTGLDSQRDRLLLADHAMGYGHIEPAPPVTQLAEGMDNGGPALGCDGSPLAPANAVTTLDDDVVNITSGDLVAGGVSAPGTNVALTIDDANPDPPISVEATEAAGGAWSATVTRAQLEGLTDGSLTVSASFDGNAGNTLSVGKDTVAPGAITATPPAGPYPNAQLVTLNTGDAADVIRFTRNGSDPGPRSQRATGQISIPVSQTIRAFATDAAGNSGPTQDLVYTIGAATGGAGAGGAGTGGAAGGGGSTVLTPMTTPAALASSSASRKPYLRSFATASRVKRSVASKAGLRLTMRVASDAKVVRIRVFRKLRNGARLLIATGYRAPAGAGLLRVRLSDPGLRRKLKIGSYEVDATPGASRTNLGTTSRYGVKVVKG